MRVLVAAVLALSCCAAAAASPMRGLPPQAEIRPEAGNLLLISSWLRQHGRDGYIGGDVADAMGFSRPDNGELIAARQRGYRSDDILRVAQVSADSAKDFIVFMVQRPDDRVYFYLSTPLGGLERAFISIPSRNEVRQLDRAEAELRFREEVVYWMDRAR